MILRFAVENYKSFKEQAVFSMVAGSSSRHPSHIVTINKNRLLKSSFFFGANASGKSNFINAIDYMHRLVKCGSIKEIATLNCHFRIEPDYRTRPGVFQMDLFTEGHFYSYGISLNYAKQSIEEEWLYRIDNGYEVCLFERKAAKPPISTDIIFSEEGKDAARFDIYQSDIREDQLFLSMLGEKTLEVTSSLKEFQSVYEWFQRIIIVYPKNRYDRLDISQIQSDDAFVHLLAELDTGIMDIGSGRKPLEEAISFLPHTLRENFIKETEPKLRRFLAEANEIGLGVNGRKFTISIDNDTLYAEEMLMNHGNPDDLFSISDESDGTQRLFDLIPLYRLGTKPRVILVDEIDRSFHSKLTQNFIERYFAMTNGSQSQLICTTHDTNILNFELLRKDEIWFVERKVDHSSHIYSLNDFKLQNKTNLLNDYMHGRYGAIPCLAGVAAEDEE